LFLGLLLFGIVQTGTSQSCVNRYGNCNAIANENFQICTANGYGDFCNGIGSECGFAVNNAIYYQTTAQHINELYCNGNGPGWSNGDVTAATGGALASTTAGLTTFITVDPSHATYYVSTDQHVHELYWTGSTWTNGDVTAATGNVPVASNSALTGFPNGGTSHATYYIAANQHVYELYWTGSAWSNGDVTAVTGNILAANGSPLTSLNGNGPHYIYFVGTNQHVYELQWTGSTWTSSDVTSAAGGTLVSSGSGLSSFITNGPGRAVYYVGTNQHVYELYFTGSGWTNGDVTAATGGTLAEANSALATSFDGTAHSTYFIGTNQHIYELLWNGSSWSNSDISAAGAAPLASSTSGLSSFDFLFGIQGFPFVSNEFKQVYFVGTNQNVYELVWNGNAWSTSDLTGVLALSNSALTGWVD
jgi:hypothetical protein